MTKYFAFIPGYVLPPLVALGFVYAFTRLLSPAEYGLYAVVVSLAQLVVTAAFSWLSLSVKRFYAEAVEERWLGKLTLSVCAGYAAGAALLIAAFLVYDHLVDLTPAREIAYACGVALALARACSVIVKAFRLGELKGWRYSTMEGAESSVGLAAALALVAGLHWGTAGVVLGLTVGAAMPALIDHRVLIARLKNVAWDSAILRRLLVFGLPVTAGYALEYVMSSSDRLLIQHFLGDSAVGTYAVAYTLADRSISAVFQALSTVTYPLLMNALAKGGREGAVRQAGLNIQMLVAFGLPALAGFMIASPPIADVMAGPAFAPQARAIMPWIAGGVFLSCLRLHYVDHAFHLAKRTDVALICAIAPAALNLALNLVLIPRLGVMGAVISTVATYAIALVVDAVVSYRLFRLPVPLAALGKIVAATAAMALGLLAIRFPATPWGLAALIATGAAIYAAVALALDILGIRSRLAHRLRPRTTGSPSTP